jgi:peptidoglycan/xylan/chitin deacetylase (PgdA/CDA1 family)
VEFSRASGVPLSFAPNGIYRRMWEPQALKVRALIDAGQAQMINHTWSHRDIRYLTDADVRQELERNDDWVHQTFGRSSKPWFRPPFGAHNKRTRAIAADLGYSRILMWSGTWGDDTMGVTVADLITAARRYLQPGAIVLGHANQTVVLGLFDELERLIADRSLKPVTLNQMFFGPYQP